MRRITLAAVSTLAVLVLLFSYRTSLGDSGSTAAQAVSVAKVVAGNTAATTTGQGPDPATDPAQVTQPSTAADPSSATSDASPTHAPSATSSAAPTTTVPTTTVPTVPTVPTPTAAQPITVDGAQEMTRFGVVQVQVTIQGGRITDVVAVQYPQRERRDVEINSVAIPQLHDQVINAQSTKVDGVSGATYTTEGYLASLQSALDAAGFAS